MTPNLAAAMQEIKKCDSGMSTFISDILTAWEQGRVIEVIYHQNDAEGLEGIEGAEDIIEETSKQTAITVRFKKS